MEPMNFHQPVSTSRVRANTLLSSLTTNIVNEILDIINQEIKVKIAIYRDQMLTYAQEIDEKLSNCKDSRNKYYQICQQLTTKYSKLKKNMNISTRDTNPTKDATKNCSLCSNIYHRKTFVSSTKSSNINQNIETPQTTQTDPS
eukprot:424304_1